jgi:hypothetical protein
LATEEECRLSKSEDEHSLIVKRLAELCSMATEEEFGQLLSTTGRKLFELLHLGNADSRHEAYKILEARQKFGKSLLC